MNNNKRTAMYAGSFDPFTNGHLSIVETACELFDKVYVCIAKNPNKNRQTDVREMALAISKVLKEKNITNAQVVITDGLIAEFCEINDIKYLVRGLRNTSDYLYEENIAKINYEINPNLKTVYLRAENDVISSSLVRELHAHKKSIDKYVPEEILKLYN